MGNSIMKFVPVDIHRGTELIFCIIKHTMYFKTELRNVQRLQRVTDHLVGLGHNLALEGSWEDCQSTSGVQGMKINVM